jgi:hypothetical protein
MSSTPTQLVRDALEARDLVPRGPDHKYTARCPAHQDRSPSLSVSEGRDGQALVHCFAGCTAEDVVGALGLELRDLFPADTRRRPPLPQLQPSELPSDVVRQALREHGIDYRCTRTVLRVLDAEPEPGMWVADTCPACRHGGQWPLWIHADMFGAVRLTCFYNCDPLSILAALAKEPEAREVTR